MYYLLSLHVQCTCLMYHLLIGPTCGCSLLCSNDINISGLHTYPLSGGADCTKLQVQQKLHVSVAWLAEEREGEREGRSESLI